MVGKANDNVRWLNWGVPWEHNRRFASLDEVRAELSLESGSTVAPLRFADLRRRDLRLAADFAALRLHAYPRGDVPGVILGTIASP